MPRWLPCIILVACAWMLWEQVVSLLQGAQMPREEWRLPSAYETKAACEQQAVRASTSQAEFWARAPKATRVNRLTPTGIEIFSLACRSPTAGSATPTPLTRVARNDQRPMAAEAYEVIEGAPDGGAAGGKW